MPPEPTACMSSEAIGVALHFDPPNAGVTMLRNVAANAATTFKRAQLFISTVQFDH
jgi:hypothetical protein